MASDDYAYRYVVLLGEPERLFVNLCNTYEDMWAVLYHARRNVTIKEANKCSSAYIFTGSADEARNWVLAQRDKQG